MSIEPTAYEFRKNNQFAAGSGVVSLASGFPTWHAVASRKSSFDENFGVNAPADDAAASEFSPK